MIRAFGRTALFCLGIGALALPAGADVTNVSGTAKTTVVQFIGPFPVQTDFSQQGVPGTSGTPPVTATARLDRPDGNGSFSAAGQALALLAAPNTTGTGTPNDVGMDLGAFADDGLTGWFVESVVTERRTETLTATQAGATGIGGTGHVRSRLLLSGVMLVTTTDANATDLRNNEVDLFVSVVRHRTGQDDDTLLTGEVALVGLENSDAQVQRASGALANVFLPVVDFSNQIPQLPFVRAILFTGMELPYEYDVTPDQPFDLEVSVRTQVKTSGAGIGAAATFGTPQDGIGSVFQKVKNDDRGTSLSKLIATRVDTTGAAYVNGSSGPGAGLLFPACGTMGLESMGLLAMSGFISAVGMRRGRRGRGK